MTTMAVTLDVRGLTCGLCIGEVLERVHAVPGVEQVSVGPVRNGLSRVQIIMESTTRFVWLVTALAVGGFGVVESQGTAPGHA